MTPVTLTRFDKNARVFTRVDGYKACLSSQHDNCSGIEAHMNGLVRQLHNHMDEPTGWSFATWRSGQGGLLSNFVSASGIMLEYALGRDDTDIVSRLHDKAQRLGWTFFMFDSEDKDGNTITIVFPTTSPINEKQYARLASIFAEELDEYGMAHGCLAATHIVQIHRTTTPVVFHNKPLDAEKEIKRTAKLYQSLNARKYETKRPAGKTLTPSEISPQVVEDGLFCWFETPNETKQREALEVMARYGFSPQ